MRFAKTIIFLSILAQSPLSVAAAKNAFSEPCQDSTVGYAHCAFLSGVKPGNSKYIRMANSLFKVSVTLCGQDLAETPYFAGEYLDRFLGVVITDEYSVCTNHTGADCDLIDKDIFSFIKTNTDYSSTPRAITQINVANSMDNAKYATCNWLNFSWDIPEMRKHEFSDKHWAKIKFADPLPAGKGKYIKLVVSGMTMTSCVPSGQEFAFDWGVYLKNLENHRHRYYICQDYQGTNCHLIGKDKFTAQIDASTGAITATYPASFKATAPKNITDQFTTCEVNQGMVKLMEQAKKQALQKVKKQSST